MLINKVTNLLIHYFFLSISLADLWPSLFAVLANDLKAAQKTLSDMKSIRLGAENSLAEVKAARQAAEQFLQQSKDANATMALELENARTSLAATHDKLDSKSKALDFQVICADEAMLQPKNAESRLKAVEEDLKNQRQLLESAQKTLSMCENSFNKMISSTVVHAVALFNNHLSGLNIELLYQDFTVDDAERETLVSNAFDVVQDFVSSYDSASLTESDDNDSPKAL
jgi:DNA repair exonuclease SbcCD ATPase subunit